MKFREYGNVEVKVVVAKSPIELENLIIMTDFEYNIIDLQYSTTNTENGGIEYSALMLLSKK